MDKNKKTKKSEKQAKTKKSSIFSKLPLLLLEDFPIGLQAQVLAQIQKALEDLGLSSEKLRLTHPSDSKFGDYTTNIAMILFPEVKGRAEELKSPLDLAKKIQVVLSQQPMSVIERVEVAPPGFLNLWLKEAALIGQLRQILKLKDQFGASQFLQDKIILLEHTSPDPIKTIHIGHLRNNFLGMAMSRIFTALGAQVTLDCINNDRGTHVARAMFGYLVFGQKSLGLAKEDLLAFKITDEKVKEIAAKVDWQKLLDEWLASPTEWSQPQDLGLKSDHQNLIFYSLGDRSERLVETVKEQVRQILRDWEEEKSKVRALWRQIIDWSLSGYATTYRRIGSHHDKVWHESDLYQGGKDLVKQGLEKGIFKESKGAVVTDLSAYRLPDTVVIKSDQTALYLTFDLNLTAQKRKFLPADLYIWDIGNDQILYLKQMFAVCEQLGIGKLTDYFHLNYGYVYLEGGQKMSSRQGTVVTADELLDLLKEKARKMMVSASRKGEFTKEQIDQVAEKVGLAAVKYGLLNTNRNNEIHFDPNASVALSGSSGPYLQYTFARCQSVLKKALEQRVIFSLSEYDLFRGDWAVPGDGLSRQTPFSGRGVLPSLAKLSAQGVSDSVAPEKLSSAAPPTLAKPTAKTASEVKFEKEEKEVLRLVYQYPEMVLLAGQRIEPAVLCQFLFDLAQKFNLFYNRFSILGKPEEKEKETPEDKEKRFFRLTLTVAVAQILKNGLVILGIEPLEKM